MRHKTIIYLPLVATALDSFNWLFTPVGRVLILVTLIFGLYAAVKQSQFSFSKQVLRSAMVSLVGAVLTFTLSTRFGLGAVVASGLVGLGGAQIFKGQDQLVLYLGAFVGMSSVVRFPTFIPLIIAGFIGGVFFELVDDCWVGVEGRLGTIAAAAVVVVLIVIGGS